MQHLILTVGMSSDTVFMCFLLYAKGEKSMADEIKMNSEEVKKITDIEGEISDDAAEAVAGGLTNAQLDEKIKRGLEFFDRLRAKNI